MIIDVLYLTLADEEVFSITQDQALNMLLGSIEMEELALSHIFNLEGEMLQYILGTLPGQHPSCSCDSSCFSVKHRSSAAKFHGIVIQNYDLYFKEDAKNMLENDY